MTDDPLWLTEEQVTELLDLPDAIAQVRRHLADEHAGRALSIPKTFGTWAMRSTAHALGAVSEARGQVAFKTWVNTPDGAAATLSLFSTKGVLLAVMRAGRIGFMRTGAVSGVATDLLAAPGADTMAVVGAGRLALQQVAAVHVVRPLREVKVFSPTQANRAAVAERITEQLGVPATACTSLDEALVGRPIVTVMTSAAEPFLGADLIADGAHVNAVGAILPRKAELLPDVVEQSGLTAVDSVDNARRGSRELIEHAVGDDGWWDRVVPLHALVAGTVVRPTAPRLTIFKGMGMGLSDLAMASRVYERAQAAGLGVALLSP